MTQRERIVAWLDERGSRGLHSFELYEAGMPRGAAVICQLRKDGYEITSTDETFRGQAHGVRYRLLSAGVSDSPSDGEGPTPAEPLFQTQSPFDPWETAA